MISKEEILSKINFLQFYRGHVPSLKENGQFEAMGLCPFHQDTNPSFSVNLESGLYHCFGCQAGGDVFAFYQKLKGVSFQEAQKDIGHMVGLNGGPVKLKVVGVFKYHDEAGQVIYWKERIEPGRNNQKKEFFFYHTKNGKKVLGRGGSPLPYNLPRLIKTAGPIYFVEGEAKADLLNQWGLTSTCLDSGADSPWRPDYPPYFQDKDIIILPDNDEPGRAYAERIAGVLAGQAKSIKVVGLLGLPDKGDILDWKKDLGNTKEKLLEIVESSSTWTPKTGEGKTEQATGKKIFKAVTISDLLKAEFKPRKALLQPWLNTQGLAMIHAPRGIGKTLFAIDLTVAGTSGGTCLRWNAPEPFGVLYLDGEMPGVALQERFARAVRSSNIEPIAPLNIITPDLQENGMPDLATREGQEALEPHLQSVSLIIVDNLSTLVRSGRESDGDDWVPVQEWALNLRSRGYSIIFIHHDGKGGQQRGTSKREDVLDTVIHLKRPGDYKPEEGARFEVHFEKSRMLYGDDVKAFEAKLVTKTDGTQEWALKDLELCLTERVASLINDGVPQSEIAEMLGVVKGTVSKHKNKAHTLGLLK